MAFGNMYECSKQKVLKHCLMNLYMHKIKIQVRRITKVKLNKTWIKMKMIKIVI